MLSSISYIRINALLSLFVFGLLWPEVTLGEEWKVYNYQELLKLKPEAEELSNTIEEIRDLPLTASSKIKTEDLAYVMFRTSTSHLRSAKRNMTEGSCPESDPNDETTAFGILKYSDTRSETTKIVALADNNRALRRIARYEHLFSNTHIAEDAIYLSPGRLRKLNWLSKIRNGNGERPEEGSSVHNSFDFHWLFDIDNYFVIFSGLRSRTNVEAYIVLDCQPKDELQPLVAQSLVGERPRIVDMIGLSLEDGIEVALDLRLRKIGDGHVDAELVRELDVSAVFEVGLEKVIRNLAVGSQGEDEELHVSFRGKVEPSVLEAMALRLRLSESSGYRFVVANPRPVLSTVFEINVEDVVEERTPWPPRRISVVRACGPRLRSPHTLDLGDLYFGFGRDRVGRWLQDDREKILFSRPLQFIEGLGRKKKKKFFGPIKGAERSIVSQLRNLNRELRRLWDCVELEKAVARADDEEVEFQVSVLHSVGADGSMHQGEMSRRIGGLLRYARAFFEYSLRNSVYGGWLVHGRREVTGGDWNRLELVVTPVNRGEGGA